MKLSKKIRILTVVIVLGILGFLSVASINYVEDELKSQKTKSLIKIANIISVNKRIGNYLDTGNKKELKKTLEVIKSKIKVQFIIITNSKGIIQTHPSDSKIGIKSNCKDIDKVLKDKKSIISEWNNEFGNSLVAFEPIYKENKFLGVACVGISINDLKNELSDFLINILPVFIMTIVLAVIGSELIARNIKKSIFGLEPNEIALLLKQKELIINNIYDGLIAVNEVGDITLINDRAKDILKIENESEVYFKIKELLMEVLSKKKNILNLEMRLPKGITIMSNFSSILDGKDNLLGAIVTFQDLTIVTQMAEELTGVKELTWDLRAQNHEFLNKLQTIAGLIQLDEADKALEYIFHTVEVQDDLIKILRRIDNTSLQGLILAKYNSAVEGKINFELSNRSYMKELPNNINVQDLLCIVGNLLENSIEEVKGNKDSFISLEITQIDKLVIVVKNNGSRISEDIIEKIFDRGFTTKKGERGFGLYSIKEIVESSNGKLFLSSDDDMTEWKIEI